MCQASSSAIEAPAGGWPRAGDGVVDHPVDSVQLLVGRSLCAVSEKGCGC